MIRHITLDCHDESKVGKVLYSKVSFDDRSTE